MDFLIAAVLFLANADASLIERVLSGLIAAGPVATVLGLLSWKLWHALCEARKRVEELQATHAKQVADLIKFHTDQIAKLNKEHAAERDRMNTKTLRMAVRVQRSVEALAGFEGPPAIDEDLLDGE